MVTQRYMGDDEKPVVVVVNDGDLTESEAKKIEERMGTTEGSKREDEEEDKAFPEDGKIRFKKPVAKKRTVEGSDRNEGKQNKQKKEKKAKKNLLSFGDDEDEDEDV